MAADERWYFTKEQLANTPSRKCGIDADKELRCRQQAANFIQDMGQRLQVSQLCINTAIVYMHRFYVFHSLTHFHRNSIATAALFLAAKVEEQPRKLEHVIRVANMCIYRETQALDVKSEQYLEQAQDLVFNENVLLQTLGFDVAIDHPHTHVVRCCHLVKASKDLAQTSYFMASNSLHLTTMCLQYKPTVVACFCIHLASKWSNWEIPQSNEGKYWFWYVDKTVTNELLGQLTDEFLHIFDKCPSRLKQKIKSMSNQSPMQHPPITNSPFDIEPRKVQSPANADGSSLNFQSSIRTILPDKPDSTDGNLKKPNSMSSRPPVDYREYREKKERERFDREKAASANTSIAIGVDTNKHHSHHHKQSSSASITNKHSSSSATSSSSSMKQAVHHNHHHSSRQDLKNSQLLSQRHSSTSNSSGSSQPRDRPRVSRDYNASNSLNNSYGLSLDNALDITNFTHESSTIHPPEKLSNNAQKSHSSDSRHNKQGQVPQKDHSKPYAKYADLMRRKPDSLEQRSEEVRKLIEKPLPPPKPMAEVRKEEYAAMMLKQSHHPSKYEKPSLTSMHLTQSASLPMAESKLNSLSVGQTAFSIEKSPNAPVPASQIPHKSQSASAKSNQVLPVKNGSSSSFNLLNNIDDAKVEKRPRGQHEQENTTLQTPPPPATKHRSLFSPEKTPTPMPRESLHPQKPRLKQKSPVVPKSELLPPFTSPNSMLIPEQTQSRQKLSSSSNSMSHTLQKHRSNIEEQSSKQPALDRHSHSFALGFGMPESLNNRVSDLAQVMKENTAGDVKSSVDSKSFDLMDPIINHQHNQQHGLNNGLDMMTEKQEFSTVDSSFLIKAELPDDFLRSDLSSQESLFAKQEPQCNIKQEVADFLSFNDPIVKTESSEKPELVLKQERFSPLKSAQSISALLQEPLAPMPSLLQVPIYEQQQKQQVEDDKVQLQQQLQPEPALPSTVDMSDLAAAPIVHYSIELPTPASAAPSATEPSTVALVNPAPVAGAEDKSKSEHRSKSDKKKEKKKHKHKDKEKSKEKHKHKHKDKEKDREKHHRDKSDREKDKTDEGSSGNGNAGTLMPVTVPIKITIPKDKLNLSSDSIGTSASAATTTPNSGLKIKIPKERLKGAEVSSQQAADHPNQANPTQAPLKLKIRTEGLSRIGSAPDDMQASQSLDSSRKRERNSDPTDLSGMPPAKKTQQQQQRPNERQNGRHNSYGPGSNNKVRGGGRGHPPNPRLLPAYYQQRGEAGYYHAYQEKQKDFLRHPHPNHPHHQFYNNYPPAVQAPVFAIGYTGGMYDPRMFYSYPQQQQPYPVYPPGGMAYPVNGQIDTSVPPPPICGQMITNTNQPPPPPLPSGPPPNTSPPPPPPPE